MKGYTCIKNYPSQIVKRSKFCVYPYLCRTQDVWFSFLDGISTAGWDLIFRIIRQARTVHSNVGGSEETNVGRHEVGHCKDDYD